MYFLLSRCPVQSPQNTGGWAYFRKYEVKENML